MSQYNAQHAAGSMAYNLAAGNERLSEHFVLSEFASKDGSLSLLVHPVLIEMLEEVRLHFGGRPVIINSGYRTRAHNAAINGSRGSYHCFGMAADIVVRDIAPSAVATYAEEMLQAGGVGRYATFTHLDVRNGKARWKG